jgi:hypothetical protein
MQEFLDWTYDNLGHGPAEMIDVEKSKLPIEPIIGFLGPPGQIYQTVETNQTRETHYCGICSDAITDGQTYWILPDCGHPFHADSSQCLDGTIVKWLSINPSCPICRKKISAFENK